MKIEIKNINPFELINCIRNMEYVLQNTRLQYISVIFESNKIIFFSEFNAIFSKIHIDIDNQFNNSLKCFVAPYEFIALLNTIEYNHNSLPIVLYIDYSQNVLIFNINNTIAKIKFYTTIYDNNNPFVCTDGYDKYLTDFNTIVAQHTKKIYSTNFYSFFKDISTFIIPRFVRKHVCEDMELKNIMFICKNDTIGMCVFTHEYILLNEVENIFLLEESHEDFLIHINSELFFILDKSIFTNSNDYITLIKSIENNTFIFWSENNNWISDGISLCACEEYNTDFWLQYDGQIKESYSLNPTELIHNFNEFLNSLNNELVSLRYDHDLNQLIIENGSGFLTTEFNYDASVIIYSGSPMTENINISYNIMRDFLLLCDHTASLLTIHRTIDNNLIILEVACLENNYYDYSQTVSKKNKIYIYGK